MNEQNVTLTGRELSEGEKSAFCGLLERLAQRERKAFVVLVACVLASFVFGSILVVAAGVTALSRASGELDLSETMFVMTLVVGIASSGFMMLGAFYFIMFPMHRRAAACEEMSEFVKLGRTNPRARRVSWAMGGTDAQSMRARVKVEGSEEQIQCILENRTSRVLVGDEVVLLLCGKRHYGYLLREAAGK
jgi:hypothetical protein